MNLYRPSLIGWSQYNLNLSGLTLQFFFFSDLSRLLLRRQRKQRKRVAAVLVALVAWKKVKTMVWKNLPLFVTSFCITPVDASRRKQEPTSVVHGARYNVFNFQLF